MLPRGKGKIAALIVAKLKEKSDGKDHEQEEREEPEGDELDPGLEAAADDVITAVKRGDAEALARALRAFHELCADEG